MLVLSSGSTTSGTSFLPSSLVCWWAPPSPGNVCSSDWPAQEVHNITTLCGLHISLTYFMWGLISTLYPAYFIQQAGLYSTASAAPGVVGPALLLRMIILALVQIGKRVFASSSDSFRFRENKKYSTLKMVGKSPWRLSNMGTS